MLRVESAGSLDQDLKQSGRRVSLTVDVGEPRVETPAGKKAKRVDKPSTADEAHILSRIYAIVLVLFGFIFPLSEAIQEAWLQEIYNGIFLVYIYVLATAFILYLQIYLIHQPPPGHKPTDERQPSNTSHSNNLVITDGHRVSVASVSAISIQQTPDLDTGSEFMGEARMPNGHPAEFSERNRNASGKSENSTASREADRKWLDLEGVKSIFAHEGSSLYLRFGFLVFGIGNIIYIVLELEYYIGNNECDEAMFGWTFFLRLIFILVQTFFIFKNAKVHIHKHEPLARFGFMHLIATNLCVWIRTLIEEILHDMHKSDHEDDNVTSHSALEIYASEPSECSDARATLDEATPYLFPFILEYSLIALGMAAIMYEEIGHDENASVINNLKSMLRVHSVSDSDAKSKPDHHHQQQHHGSHGDSHLEGIDMRNAHRGIFIGILFLAGMIVSMILFYFAQDDPKESHEIYLISDIVLHSALLLAAALALFQLSKLSFTFKPTSVDDMLVMVSMAGSFLFEVSITMAYGTHISTGEHVSTTDILTFSASLIAATQTLLQTILVIGGLRMYVTKRIHLRQMPGREVITFMIIGNVTVWIFRTMQVKQLEHGIQEDYYGQLTWLLLMNINLPLLLFFRFHCSVCLADIWHAAYRPIGSHLKTEEIAVDLPLPGTPPMFEVGHDGPYADLDISNDQEESQYL